MDITAIPPTFTSLKVATSLIKGILEAKNKLETQPKLIELQEALLEMQTDAISTRTAQVELLEQVRALKEQLKAFNDWDEQRPRYTLVCPWNDAAQVYALHEASSDGEQPHFLCPNCFHKRHRMILNQIIKTANRFVSLACPSCKASIDTSFRGIGAPKYAEEYPPQ